jgi:hypothetical protein
MTKERDLLPADDLVEGVIEFLGEFGKEVPGGFRLVTSAMSFEVERDGV